MKIKIFMACAALVVSAAAVVGVKAYNHSQLSDLALANIEALGETESSKKKAEKSDKITIKEEERNHIHSGFTSSDEVVTITYKEIRCIGTGYVECTPKPRWIVEKSDPVTETCPYDNQMECDIERNKIKNDYYM